MKASIRFLICTICLLLLVPLTIISASAEEQTIKQQNQTAANEKITLLMNQQSDYVHKLTEDPQNISGKTNAVIKRYLFFP